MFFFQVLKTVFVNIYDIGYVTCIMGWNRVKTGLIIIYGVEYFF
jgi:hypothetical protein